MSLTYGFYGGATALTVVGLCMNDLPGCYRFSLTHKLDLLFTGDGEAFNASTLRYVDRLCIIMSRRLGNF